MFSVRVSIVENEVRGEFIADSYFFEPSKYDYAFYLYQDDKRINTKWYTNSMDVRFSIENSNGLFYIKVFVKDKEDDSKRIFDSEKISVGI